MEQYLKLFKNQAEYEAESEKPQVSHIVEEVDVIMPVSYDNQYLTFELLEDSTFKVYDSASYSSVPSYSTDGGSTWTTLPYKTDSPTIAAGTKVMWKGNLTVGSWGVGQFQSTGKVNVYGNVLSLIYGDDFRGKTTVPTLNKVFYYLFHYLKIVSAENLILPILTLGEYSYSAMFVGCRTLEIPPKVLPATTIDRFSYQQMFSNCTSLKTIPEMKVTEFRTGQNCSAMFEACTSLKKVPELPSFTAPQCYIYMFSGCTGLEEVAQLKATTLSSSCYYRMFAGCTSLRSFPELPATELVSSCYYEMFIDCTSLANAPKIAATSITGYWDCAYMFQRCTSLEEAPELFSKDIPAGSYAQMFDGCTSLRYVKCHAETFGNNNSIVGWLKNVSPTGLFIKKANVNYPSGMSGIPEGWTVENM